VVVVKEERINLIRDWISSETSVSIGELSNRLGVSRMTVWRDLTILHEEGSVQRVHGGAIKRGNDFPLQPLFEVKYNLHVEEKRAIGQYAVNNFVHNDEIVILEGGTTVGSMVQFLSYDKLTVLTNNLNILVQAANHHPWLRVMSSGGILRESSPTFVGPHAQSFFLNMKAHTYFFGAVAFNLTDGITDPDPIEIQVKRAMRKCANKVVLMIDSSKFGKRSLEEVFPLSEVDSLITDKNAPEAMISSLREMGVDVHIAG
jgi:DeoR/GlpR family transcriptional regulator of sugar metabolism